MRFLGNERGAVLVFVTLMIVLLLVMVGMGLDSGQLGFVRSQGQRAVDAAALAGASAIPTGSDPEVYNRVIAFNAKNDYVASSVAANQLKSQDVTFIQYDEATGTITKVGSALEANGVRVALEPSNPYGGPVGGAMTSSLFLTPLFNLLGLSTPATANVRVSAAAYVKPIPAMPIALAGCPLPNPAAPAPPICTLDGITDSCDCKSQGTIKIPDGNGGEKDINKCSCTKCTLLQVPSPKQNSCYTTFKVPSANAKSIKEMVNNNQTCSAIPLVTYYDPIYLNNGQINSVLNEIKNMANFNGRDVAPTKPDHCYLIPVVPSDTDCNRVDPLSYYAEICIREVDTQGSPKYIFGDLTCPVYPTAQSQTKCFTPRLVRDVPSGM